MRFNESQARTVLWIKAIEENDPHGAVFTRAQRVQAGRAARSEEETGSGATLPDEPFVVGRAEILLGMFRKEFPSLQDAPGTRWGMGHLGLLLLVALVAGLFANYFGPERRINVLAFPLLGVLAWNLAAYLVLLIRAVAAWTRRDSTLLLPGFLTGKLFNFTWAKSGEGSGEPAEKDRVLAAGLKQFRHDWRGAALPLYALRLRLALHLGSAFLALGILSGMYLRGLGYEYQAGWESTFLNAEAVHRILSLVLGPASLLAGIPIPGLEQIAQMRWREGQPGVDAAPWIHLYAVTALLVIFVPRLILATSAFIRLKLLEHNFSLDSLESSAYIRKITAQGVGRGASVQVVPYNYALEGRLKEALFGLLRDCLGWSTEIRFNPVSAYGGEDAFLAGLRESDEPAADYLAALFNLAATPEEETHGRLLGGLREQVKEGRIGQQLLVLINVSPYRARFADQEFFEKRMAERVQAWMRLADHHGLRAVLIDLEQLPADFSCDLLQENAWSPTPPARA